jgi:hypothetical protein
MKLLGVTTVGGGGVVGYAWYDPSFRKMLDENVPYAKETLDAIFELLPPEGQLPPLPTLTSLPTLPTLPGTEKDS